MATQCKACNGVYEALSADNVPYAHVCPPRSLVHVKRAGAWTDIDLASLAKTDTVIVRRGDVLFSVFVSDAQGGDVRVGDTTVERSNKRDENPDITRAAAKDGTRPMKAAGAGVQAV